MGQALSRLDARLTSSGRQRGGMIMQRFTVLSVMLSALVLPLSAQAQFDHEHQAWTELLKKHIVVSEGGTASHVRYAALAADSDALKSYLSALSKVGQDEF